MARFREHRGSLTESMGTVVEVKDFDDLLSRLQELHPQMHLTKKDVVVRYWVNDKRIGWETYIILHRTQPGVLGFLDENLV